MVEFIAYTLFVLVMIGALRHMMSGVELESSADATSPAVLVEPAGKDGSSSAHDVRFS